LNYNPIAERRGMLLDLAQERPVPEGSGLPTVRAFGLGLRDRAALGREGSLASHRQVRLDRIQVDFDLLRIRALAVHRHLLVGGLLA
jgi:hypothetical protein